MTGDLSALMRTSMLCWNSERGDGGGLLRRVEGRLQFRMRLFMRATLANLVLPSHPGKEIWSHGQPA